MLSRASSLAGSSVKRFVPETNLLIPDRIEKSWRNFDIFGQKKLPAAHVPELLQTLSFFFP